jgi:hypothetical protein
MHIPGRQLFALNRTRDIEEALFALEGEGINPGDRGEDPGVGSRLAFTLCPGFVLGRHRHHVRELANGEGLA